MNPSIGLKITDSKLKESIKRALFLLELAPVDMGSGGDSYHLGIVDQLGEPTSLPLILIAPNPDSSELSRVINSGVDVVWFEHLPEGEVFADAIKNCLEDSVWSQQSILLSKEINFKNRQLEQMNSDLERVVEQRTSSVFEEKKEAELKQKRIRKLVEFIQRLSDAETVEDYIEIVKKEFRSNFAVTDVFLGSPGTHSNLKELRLELANRLSRPVGKIFQLQLHPRFERALPHGSILIEHGMDDSSMKSFAEFTSERLQIMSLALERILLFHDLAKSSLEWERTFDTLADPVGIVDVDYRLLRSNSAFGDPSYHTKCHRIFSGSDVVCEGCPIAEVSANATSRVSHIRRASKTYRVHSYPIRMQQDSSVTTVVNHYVDITEDRLLYSRVVQHEKMTALGIMAGHIAHELNNPLTGIRSLCQVLAVDPNIAENIKNDLKEIESASERCQIIIRNLLEFTLQRDENGIQRVSLNDVVRKTLPMLKTAMRLHSNEVDLDEGERPIMANPHLLQQVVFNLVNNSCQAMVEPGQVEIKTRYEKGNMILRVTDTGPGISEENLPRLFEPFFTTKALGEGTGLGLSMSRSIVEKFGGQIKLIATGPKGTVFEITFPEAKE